MSTYTFTLKRLNNFSQKTVVAKSLSAAAKRVPFGYKVISCVRRDD